VFAREFGFRPKLSARLEFWEEWLLVEGLNRDAEAGEAKPERGPSWAHDPSKLSVSLGAPSESLASLGINVKRS
jgi:hypothetical protein